MSRPDLPAHLQPGPVLTDDEVEAVLLGQQATAAARLRMARARAEALRAEQEEALRDLESRAYFAARLALIDRPDVRLFTRDVPRRGDLIQVYAEGKPETITVSMADALVEFDVGGPLPIRYGTMTFVQDRPGVCARALVSTGNAAEPEVLDHQARALARYFPSHLRPSRAPDGAELYAAEQVIR